MGDILSVIGICVVVGIGLMFCCLPFIGGLLIASLICCLNSDLSGFAMVGIFAIIVPLQTYITRMWLGEEL